MTVEVLHGDCVELMRRMPDDSVDAVVTDPPYELGFMGKAWDGAGIAYSLDMWGECLRVLKPGGHLLAFGGTRTYHRMACAIEDAGFEIRDSIHWVYGSGFPKSLDVSKAIDKASGAQREVVGKYTVQGTAASGGKQGRASVAAEGKTSIGLRRDLLVTAPATDEAKRYDGWGTALKPAHEPIVVARKPLEGTVAANVLKWGTGGLNIDGCRVGTDEETARKPAVVAGTAAPFGKGVAMGGRGHAAGRWPANVVFDSVAGEALDQKSGERPSAGEYTHSLSKPELDWAPFGGMPRTGKQKRSNAYANETGGASRFFTCADWSDDDWPFVYVPKPGKKERNAGLDGLEEVTAGQATGGRKEGSDGLNSPRAGAGLTGGAKNHHPTVKPVALMRHLVRLVTPPDGTVLDPFAGSGTTLVAAVLEGFNAVGCEMTDEYLPIIEGRVAWAQQEAERRTTEQQPNLFQQGE